MNTSRLSGYPLPPHIVFLSYFATFKITPRMIKILYLHILQAYSTENYNAFCKLIVIDNYKLSKKSKKSVLRYIENISGSVGNFVKCIISTLFYQHYKNLIYSNMDDRSMDNTLVISRT